MSCFKFFHHLLPRCVYTQAVSLKSCQKWNLSYVVFSDKLGRGEGRNGCYGVFSCFGIFFNLMSAEISANWKYSIYPQNSVGRKHQIVFLALQEFGLVGHLTCEIVIKRASEVIKIIQSPTIYHAKPRNAIRILKAVKKSIIPKSLLCWLYSRQYKMPTCKCCQEKA